MSSIVKMTNYARIGVRPIGIAADTDALDDRINFDSIYAADPVAQRMVDVITRSRADNKYIPKWRAAGTSLEQVNQRILGAARLERLHLLVAAIVDEDGKICWIVAYGVIGRPEAFAPLEHPVCRPWQCDYHY
jgi:hypothetical protein